MAAFDDISDAQAAITLRRQAVQREVVADYILECDHAIRDGGAYAGVAAPPLRVRDMDVVIPVTTEVPAEGNLNASGMASARIQTTSGEDVLALKSVAMITEVDGYPRRQLEWTSYDNLVSNASLYEYDDIFQYTFVGSEIYTPKPWQLELLGTGALPFLTNENAGDHWLYRRDKFVYGYFVAARVLENARLPDEAAKWANRYSEKIVRLNRTYGSNAFMRGAKTRYRGSGYGIGRAYPQYW